MNVEPQEYWAEEISKAGNQNLAENIRNLNEEQLQDDSYLDALKDMAPEHADLIEGLKDDLKAESGESAQFPVSQYQGEDKTTIAQELANWLVDEKCIKPVVLDGSTLFYEYDRSSKVWSQKDWEIIQKIPSKHVQSQATTHFLNQFRQSFKHHHKIMHFEDLGLDSSEVLLKDGQILDMDDMETRPAKMDDKAINCVNASYQEDAEPNRIKQFLERTIDTEDGLKTLQEYLGYTLTWPSTKYEKALLILGNTDTGKSTLLELLEKFFERSETTNMSFPDIGMERSFHVGRLKDSVVNIDHDMDDKNIKSHSTLKKAISNNKMMADPKGSDGYQFRPRARFLIASNNSPDDSGSGQAFYNRFLTLQATKRVSEDEKDRELVDKLSSEENMSWLLNWAIEGLKRLQEQNRFTLNRTEYETKKLWDKFGTSTQKFVSEQIEVDHDEGKNIPTEDLYNTYKDWCETELATPVSQYEFVSTASDCADMHKAKVQAYDGTGRRSCFKNLTLNDYVL